MSSRSSCASYCFRILVAEVRVQRIIERTQTSIGPIGKSEAKRQIAATMKARTSTAPNRASEPPSLTDLNTRPAIHPTVAAVDREDGPTRDLGLSIGVMPTPQL